jgi:hypothetical protein
MQPVHVTLDAEAIATGRDLVDRYGPGASLSAVVRRALAMLDEVWAAIGEDAVTQAHECERFAKFAGTAQRKPLKSEGSAETFDLAAALDEYNAAEAGIEF